MVSGAYDQGKTNDAGGYQTYRFGDRAGGRTSALSSRNPDIDELGKNKSRIILLNKSDLADARKNKLWMNYFSSKGFHVLEINSKTGAGVKSIQGVVQEACKEK